MKVPLEKWTVSVEAEGPRVWVCVASFHSPDQEGPRNAAAAGCQETLWAGLRAQRDLRPLIEPLGDFGGGACLCVAVPGLSCSSSVAWHVGSSSLTRDQTQAPCSVSAES